MNIEEILKYVSKKINEEKTLTNDHKQLILKLVSIIFDEKYIIESKRKDEDETGYFEVSDININTYKDEVKNLKPMIQLLHYYPTTFKIIPINQNYNIFLKEINDNIKVYKNINNTDIFPKIEKITQSLLNLDLD